MTDSVKPSAKLSVPSRLLNPGWYLLAPLLLFLSITYIVPLLGITGLSVTDPEPGFGNYGTALTDPLVRKAFSGELYAFAWL